MSRTLFSIITVTKNSASTLPDTIKSVRDQSYPHIEYLVVDGGSSDDTIQIARSFDTVSKFISEPDKGIYDAINKGIRMASGDVIGLLHSDDFFTHNDVIEQISVPFADPACDAVLADALFVDPLDVSRIVRYYSSANFNPSRFKFGFMPAHTGFYARKTLFEKFGFYKTDYKIAADFELMLRIFTRPGINYKYLPVPVASMRMGGVSNRSVMSKIILNREIARACKENGIRTNYLNIYSKYFLKIFEFLGNYKQG